MTFLEEKIMKDGQIKPGHIVKVDNFLNHQIDPNLMEQIAEEFYRVYGDKKITKIMTIEASGIAIAIMAARRFGVPMVFAKKARSANISDNLFTSAVKSYTYGNIYNITVSKEFLNGDDHILIVDDFLAMGSALNGLLDIVRQAGATVEGIGICVEKTFQPGGEKVRSQGYEIHSIARIKELGDDGSIVFVED